MSISTSTSDVNEPLNPLEDGIDDDELENESPTPTLGTFFITKEITTIYPQT